MLEDYLVLLTTPRLKQFLIPLNTYNYYSLGEYLVITILYTFQYIFQLF